MSEAKELIDESHPTWVRGLKLKIEKSNDKLSKSHPTWVRGLKQV